MTGHLNFRSPERRSEAARVEQTAKSYRMSRNIAEVPCGAFIDEFVQGSFDE